MDYDEKSLSINTHVGYGMRISEVLNLKLKDFYMEDLRIIGKGGKIRLIPIVNELIFLLKK